MAEYTFYGDEITSEDIANMALAANGIIPVVNLLELATHAVIVTLPKHKDVLKYYFSCPKADEPDIYFAMMSFVMCHCKYAMCVDSRIDIHQVKQGRIVSYV